MTTRAAHAETGTTRTLADYQPQHDRDCDIRLCRHCDDFQAEYHHWSPPMMAPNEWERHTFEAKDCSCGLDALIAAVRHEAGADRLLKDEEIVRLKANLAQLIKAEEAYTANERLALRKLSDSLTGGSAGTWDEIFHAADRLHPHEDGVSPLPRQAQEVRTLTADELALLRRAIRPLDCGALHCRYCKAGSSNRWQHAEHCAYAESTRDAESARQLLDALLLLSDHPHEDVTTVLDDLWLWASEQRTHLATDPVPDGLGARVLAALNRS